MDDACMFSVVIPSFNRAAFLLEAIDSVFAQGMNDVEVIVVDDGSTDDTREVIARYPSRVRYFHQERSGAASARNVGVRFARGAFISFLDSDDLFLPGKMKTEAALFEEIPEADAIISDCEKWTEGVRVSDSWLTFKGVEVPAAPSLMQQNPPLWIKSSIFATCCITIRRPSLDRMGGEAFDTSLEGYEDWDFDIRLLRYCKVLVVPTTLAKVRRFDDGTRDEFLFSGRTPPLDHEREVLTMRNRVLLKALGMDGWPEEVKRQIEAERSSIEDQLLERGAAAPNVESQRNPAGFSRGELEA